MRAMRLEKINASSPKENRLASGNCRRGSIGLVVASSLLAMSGCAFFGNSVISVEPDPDAFGREYPGDFVAAGRKIALVQRNERNDVRR